MAAGGAEQRFRYGTKIDQYFIFETEKLGLWKGGKLITRVDTALGQNSILDAVPFAPANTAFLTPNFSSTSVTALTHCQFEQELGHGFAATAGKFNFIDLWSAFYPDYGKGLDGFMNINSIIFLNVVPTLPIVFNGAGLIKAGKKGIEGAVMVIDSNNIPTVSGINQLADDGVTMLGAYRVFTEFAGLPGSHLVAGTYGNRQYTTFDPVGWFALRPGIPILPITNPQTGSWLGTYVGEQNLWVDSQDPKRRVFFLTTMGWADRNTSPYEWMGTFSVEARGMSDRRPHDRMGIGYFYSDISDDLERDFANIGLQDVQGGEVYYNAAVTPWFHLTGDMQVLQSELATDDDAWVLGMRAKITL